MAKVGPWALFSSLRPSGTPVKFMPQDVIIAICSGNV
jgi:hypothetical protein